MVGRDGSLKDHHALIDQANTLALTSDLLVAGGGALVITAAVLYFFRDSVPEQPHTTAAVTSDGRTTLLTLRGSF